MHASLYASQCISEELFTRQMAPCYSSQPSCPCRGAEDADRPMGSTEPSSPQEWGYPTLKVHFPRSWEEIQRVLSSYCVIATCYGHDSLLSPQYPFSRPLVNNVPPENAPGKYFISHCDFPTSKWRAIYYSVVVIIIREL